ncbi:MAG: Rrf2 family transcriptional regulator [Planctomycetes bacterium]|nr:Rrf2 family transcriptional regulator [Planctomycetota bacterium]MCH8966462.1 Rrf2 family transcriptional regulator [Planctomycetota bacterium]
MISSTAEYALRAIVALAQGDGDAMVTRRIAEITKVPPGYLSKILQILGKRGLVRSRRGPGGGFVLARPTSEMTVLDVVNAVDPIKRIERCPLDLNAHGESLCSLHQRLDAATALIERAFAETTVADVLADTGRSAPLCERHDG